MLDDLKSHGMQIGPLQEAPNFVCREALAATWSIFSLDSGRAAVVVAANAHHTPSHPRVLLARFRTRTHGRSPARRWTSWGTCRPWWRERPPSPRTADWKAHRATLLFGSRRATRRTSGSTGRCVSQRRDGVRSRSLVLAVAALAVAACPHASWLVCQLATLPLFSFCCSVSCCRLAESLLIRC